MDNKEVEVIESKALSLLEKYEGANNYIIKLKQKKESNKHFIPTRSQCDYIINYSNTTPKIAKKWVELDTYFAQKFSEDKLLPKVPENIWIEKLLVERDKSYHIWGKFFSGDTNHDIWLPKTALIKTQEVKKVEIDYSKYDHRPPLDHQKEAIERLVSTKKFILADSMGVGKALKTDTLIFTPTGTKRFGDLKVGDKVIGSNGKSCNVIGVYPQGIKDIYKITFNDGFSIECCKEHLWTVSSASSGENTKNSKNRYITLSVEQMLDENLILEQKCTKCDEKRPYKFKTYYKVKNGDSKWQIPIVKPIEFENNDVLPIDPYLLGLLLGDGGISTKSIKFTTIDDELLDSMKMVLPENIKIVNNGKLCYRLSKIEGAKNPLIQDLKKLNLMGTKSHTKFIPNVYKYSSIENRLSILQGLMDTDGHCMTRNNTIFHGTEYSTSSKQLCDDVVEIVHSLGGIARVRSRTPSYTHKGVKSKGKLSYRVNIKLPEGFNPFRLKRKSELYNEPKKYRVGRYIKNIEPCGQAETLCISVDSPDKLYVVEHGIVTHNTTSAAIASLETGVEKILIICPSSLKLNWKKELENYTNRPIYIAEGKHFSLEHDIVIVNYDILKNFYDLNEKEKSLITKAGFDLVIIDEAHFLQNPQATRTKIVNSFAKNVKYLWLLTGTPMTSRPMNYFNLLSLIESPVAANWMAYAIRYCEGYQFSVGKKKIWNTSGASNLDELRERTSKQFLRRLKEDVLDLPEKIITPVYLELKSKEYEELVGEYYDWYNKSEESKSLTIQFSKLMKVRQVIANEKIKHTIELTENIIAQEKKVIIFTNFTNTLQQIYQHFGKKAVFIDGSCSTVQRQYAVDQFQENDKIMVFVGNLKAAGAGITLTAAEACIMNDLSFVPSDHQQAEDRAYRYGQKNCVSIYYPLFHNTIEGIIYDMLINKKNIIDTVMGDNINTGDVVEEIMCRINNI